MNWLDIAILCLVAAGLIKGLYDGMIRQVVSIIALITGICFSSAFAEWLRTYLTQFSWLPPQGLTMFSYSLGFILIVAFVLLVGKTVHHLVKITPLGIFNHITGGLLGIVIVTLFTSFIFNTIEIIDKKSVLLSQEIKVESRYYNMIRKVIPEYFPKGLLENTYFNPNLVNNNE